jgi:TatD DNase family protein
MQLIDTHTHIYLPEFDSDRDEIVERAVRSGVKKLLLPNIDLNSIGPMLAAVSGYQGVCLPMLGLHPTSVKSDFETELEKILNLFPDEKYIAIGEIGIDLYWDKTHIQEQIIAMRKQIQFAIEKGLPVVIHSRDSFSEVFSVLDEFRGKGLRGVLHAFTGGIKEAEKALDLGFKLGIGGIVTFKNSGLSEVVKQIGPQNIILETDSPYLAPVPHRGKRNESSYICIINKKLAEIFGIDEKEVAAITTAGANQLFNL